MLKNYNKQYFATETEDVQLRQCNKIEKGENFQNLATSLGRFPFERISSRSAEETK